MNISLFYDNVTVLDYAYLDAHKGLIGNSLKVHVEFIGHTDEEGILYDFSYAKKKVKEIIDRDCDHRVVVPRHVAQRENGRIYFNYRYGLEGRSLEYWAPEEAICEIPFANISYATICAYLEEQVLKEMPDTVDAVRLTVEEEKNDDHNVYFNYTHGLKDHYGNCQRLFHGHRNTIQVWVNGERSSVWENKLSTELFSGNIHFAFWENVVNKDEITSVLGTEKPVGRFANMPDVQIKYVSGQGEFEAFIPGDMIYIMPIESTVENISIHFANIVKSHVGTHVPVQVKAFEGIAKGAISRI